jgi:hypothetical protein
MLPQHCSQKLVEEDLSRGDSSRNKPTPNQNNFEIEGKEEA